MVNGFEIGRIYQGDFETEGMGKFFLGDFCPDDIIGSNLQVSYELGRSNQIFFDRLLCAISLFHIKKALSLIGPRKLKQQHQTNKIFPNHESEGFAKKTIS